MKDIESVRSDDATLTLVLKRVNIKLDKLTTYVFAASDLPQKSKFGSPGVIAESVRRGTWSAT
jgi:hypothetical protein